MTPRPPSPVGLAANVVALLGSLLILAALIFVMYHYTRPEPVDQARWADRKKNLSEIQARSRETLGSYAWIDQARGLARLPIDRALELTVKEWQNPQAGRSNLLARLERSIPPTPSVPPAATNTPAAVKAPGK